MSTERRLQRTERAIQRQIPQWIAASIIPRGIAIPLDKFLTGQLRFARRIGNVFPVFSPACAMRLTDAIHQGERSLTVDAVLPVLPDGSIISFAGRELQFLESSLASTGTLSIQSTDGFLATYAPNTKIILHAVPITVTLDVAAGATEIEVESDHLIVLGDQLLEVLNEGVAGSALALRITGVEVVQEDTAPFSYVLTLDSPLLQGYDEDEEVYLRAFPAIKSQLIPLPTQLTSLGGNVGPFLWDYLEGRLHDGLLDPTVTAAVSTYSPAHILMQDLTEITKNEVYLGVNLPAQMLGLWDRHLGQMDYVGDYPRATLDAAGDFLIGTQLAPAFPGDGHYWLASFYSESDVDLRIGFHYETPPDTAPTPPGAAYTWEEEHQTMYYDVALTGSTEVRTLQVLAPDVAYDRITVGAYGVPGQEITLRDWASSVGHTTWVQYTMVANVGEDYAWAGSGLIIKPLFESRDALAFTDRLDTGFVAL